MHLLGSLGNLLTRCFLFITQPAVVPNEPKGNLSFSYIHGSCATGDTSSAHRVRTSHQKMKFVVTTSLPTFFLSVTEAQQGGLVDYLTRIPSTSSADLLKCIQIEVDIWEIFNISVEFGNTSVDYFAMGLYIREFNAR